MRAAAVALAVALLAGCGHTYSSDQFGWFGDHGRPRSGAALQVRWTKRLTPDSGGPYMPVERASAALDPERDRIYVGSTAGELLALKPDGRVAWRFDAGGAIEAEPALDAYMGQLYAVTEEGVVHALRAYDGTSRWERGLDEPIRQPPVLTADAVYVVTDMDRIVALSRDDGEPLWEAGVDRGASDEGFSISGHAGLTLADGKLLTGQSDGRVLALDPTDGRIVWEVHTALDLPAATGEAPQFVDVDTTPVVVDGLVYVASFTGGLYALTLSGGTVQWRDEARTGVVSLAAAGRRLVVASADSGITCLSLEGREPLWSRPVQRGAPTPLRVVDGVVLVGETEGSFVALALSTGGELGRMDAGHGFSAPAAASHGLGFVLTNGGSLLAFSLGG